MECPYCNTELEQIDSFGNSNYILRGDQNGKSGDIFKCPNHEGFEDDSDTEAYLELIGEEIPLNIDAVREVVCESSVHHVSGSFYTDRNGDLQNGYPC